jgi:hypothetical protein
VVEPQGDIRVFAHVPLAMRKGFEPAREPLSRRWRGSGGGSSRAPHCLCGQSLRPRIGPLKRRNSAVPNEWLLTSIRHRRANLSNSSSVTLASNGSSIGYFVGVRPDADTGQGFIDGALAGSVSTASDTVISQSFAVLAGATTFQSTRRVALARWGAALSDAELAALYEAFAYYLNAIGAI